MEWKECLPLIGTAIAAAIAVWGWYKGNQLAAERDRQNKKRDLRTSFLISAYSRIESVSGRDGIFTYTETDEAGRALAQKYKEAVQAALADVQLWGTPRQVELVTEIMDGVGKGHVATRPLLNELRDDLRKEFNLEPIQTDVRHLDLRLEPRKNDNAAPPNGQNRQRAAKG